MRVLIQKKYCSNYIIGTSNLSSTNVRYSKVIRDINGYHIIFASNFTDPQINHPRNINICSVNNLTHSELVRLYNQIGKILLTGDNK